MKRSGLRRVPRNRQAEAFFIKGVVNEILRQAVHPKDDAAAAPLTNRMKINAAFARLSMSAPHNPSGIKPNEARCGKLSSAPSVSAVVSRGDAWCQSANFAIKPPCDRSESRTR